MANSAENFTHSTNANLSLQDIPITSLRSKTRCRLSIYLNPRKILLSENGTSRDWRGVFHFTGLPSQYANHISNADDQFGELLKLWSEEQENSATLAELQNIFGLIDRWDVLDDTSEMFVNDAKEFLIQKSKSKKSNSNVFASPTVEIPNIKFNPEEDILTVDDKLLAEKGLPPQQYDAFILFADEDIDFATDVIENLENTGLKICVKDRDLLAGISFEHDAIRRLLTDRCNRLIVILSPSFIISPANEFIANLAQSLGITQRRRKIIPCLYESCNVPSIFQHMHLLNYQRSKKFNNFWEKLRNSLDTTPYEGALPSITITSPDLTITSVDHQPNTAPTTSTACSNTNYELNHLSTAQLNGNQPKKSRSFPFLYRSSSTKSLNNLDYSESNNNNNNNNNNSNTLRPLNEYKKKRKWFKKLLSPSGSKIKLAGSDSELNNCSKKKEKKWFRKKAISHS